MTRPAFRLLPLALLCACGGDAEQPPAADAAPEVAADTGGDSAADLPEDALSDATGDGSGLDVDDRDSAPRPLVADAGAGRYAWVGETVRLDASASVGALTYEWDPGDRSGTLGPSPAPVAEHVYERPGRYRAVLTVRGADGARRTDAVTVSVTQRPTHQPRHAATIARAADADRFWVVSADSDELVRIERSGDVFERTAAWSTCDHPRTVATVGEGAAVTCQDDDRVRIFDGEGGSQDVVLRWGARPWGVVAIADDRLAVSLQGIGAIAIVDRIDGRWQTSAVWPAVDDARGLAVLPDGRLLVSRWRSPDTAGQLVALDVSTGATEPWALQFVERIASDTETGGVPSYLSALVVSPQGDRVAIPTTLSNIGQGLFRNGQRLTFETTIRNVLTWLDADSGDELVELRKQFDDRGMGVAATFSSRGDWLYVLDRGARSVDTIDVLTSAQSASIVDVGYAPEGLVLTVDDAFLLVDATMSREVRVFDVRSLTELPAPATVITVPTTEPLDAVELRGKLLFNDSLDERISRDHYIACAHCHLDGEADRRTWDFTDRGEGLRNTISLLGRAGVAHGPVHWSANFDEIQDFEHDMRGPFGGRGLMDDDDFRSGDRDRTLGGTKAGQSADLDALAAYVASLDVLPRSPWREDDGSLAAGAIRGRGIFFDDATGCASCHAPPRFTDSVMIGAEEPLLHDVGTLTGASGQRLGGTLPGLDTPTLLELWNSAPYLHDGSAPTLDDVLTTRNPDDAHGVTSHLTAEQRSDLVSYLLSLEGRADELAPD